MLTEGGEWLSRVDTLPRHHDAPSPPHPGLSSKSLSVSARMQEYRSKHGAAARKGSNHCCHVIDAPRADSGSSDKKCLGCGCQQHPVRHASRLVPIEREVARAKTELWGPGQTAAPPDFGHFCFQAAAGSAGGCGL